MSAAQAQSATTAAELTFQVKAQVLSNGIQLQWNKQTGVNAYHILRKERFQKTFTVMATNIPLNDTTYLDQSVLPGQAFEYCIQSASSMNISSYVYAGIELAPVHHAGEILLLIDSTYMNAASQELSVFRKDLIKEGWMVHQEYVGRGQAVSDIKQIIQSYYSANPNQFKGVILMGHIPVPYSGKIAPDAHADHVGAWPSDVYYADVNNTQSNWNDVNINAVTASDPRNHNVIGDGKYDLSVKSAQSNIKIFVGRIDVYNMPAIHADDTYLFKQYLNKNHDYRSGLKKFRMNAVVDDEFGFFNGEAFAQNGWRNFNSILGKGQVEAGDLFTKTQSNSYIWSYACGGGWFTGAQGIGTTSSFQTNQMESVFTMLYGSYFGDWDNTNNFLRAPIARPSSTLVSCWGGRPNWFFHTMTLGEPIGYSYINSVDNISTYYPKGLYSGQVHQSLQGDPSLKMYVYDAPSNLVALGIDMDTRTQLYWSPSPDPNVIGYYIYKAASENSAFVALNTNLITSGNFIDESAFDPNHVYMVRAVKLEQTNTGTFFNLSRGAMSNEWFNTALPVNLLSFEGVANQDGSNTLVWETENEQAVLAYRLERSIDQQVFEAIANLEAKNLEQIETYQFVDKEAETISYYRVVAVDKDGQEKISPVVRLEHKPIVSEWIAFPSPFQDHIKVRFFCETPSEVHIQLCDLYGKVLQQQQVPAMEGDNQFGFQGLSHLSAGVYFLILTDADQKRNVLKVQK
jgi:fibronectin type 3 domain-containing protein